MLTWRSPSLPVASSFASATASLAALAAGSCSWGGEVSLVGHGMAWTVGGGWGFGGGVELGGTATLSIWKCTRFGDRGFLLVGLRRLL